VQLNAETLPIVAALLAVPAAVFLLLYVLTGRRTILAGTVTVLAGAAAGAFLASAGSAMSTAVDPNAAMVRGGLIGFAGSAAVALVLGIVVRLVAAGRKGP
jgi:hypothetical protein